MLSISPANPVISDDDVPANFCVRELDRHRRITPTGFFFWGPVIMVQSHHTGRRVVRGGCGTCIFQGPENSSARASPTPASLSSISLRSLVVLVVLVLVVVRAVPRDDIGVRGDGGDGCGDGHPPPARAPWGV